MYKSIYCKNASWLRFLFVGWGMKYCWITLGPWKEVADLFTTNSNQSAFISTKLAEVSKRPNNKMLKYCLRIFCFFSNFVSKCIHICDRFEQKQGDGCNLTNSLNATPLRPGSTFIDGFSKLIPQRIAVEISYLLVYCPSKSINKCGAGTQWRSI